MPDFIGSTNSPSWGEIIQSLKDAMIKYSDRMPQQCGTKPTSEFLAGCFPLSQVHQSSSAVLLMSTVTKSSQLISHAEKALAKTFEEIDEIAFVNQKRVLKAFKNNKLSDHHFAEHNGYGLGDPAREVIDEIFADLMQAESAAVRLQFVSGTHAIACSLFGNLKPGDRMISLTGRPYDTLHAVIGLNKVMPNSLADLGITYEELALDRHANDPEEIKPLIAPLLVAPTRLVHIQKSRGYSFDRKTLSNQEIGNLCKAAKACNPDIVVMVDNCFGELVERDEPTSYGADLVAGSLIKNPGGGLAITGGYVAGKKQCVERALSRLTAPGLAGRLGIMYNQSRLLMQGLFLAPSVVASATKGAMLWAQVFSDAGYKVCPKAGEKRFDIVQAIELGSAEKLIGFCKAIQMTSALDAHVVPEPGPLPGYVDPVIMAGGTFVQGANIELSADGPLRPPYVAYLQGGLTYYHVKCALEEVLNLVLA